jgi:hypothetical protein
MRQNKWLLALLILGTISSSGCTLFLIGAGATAGYAVSKDSVRNQFDLPKEYLFEQSMEVARQMGMVTLEDQSRGLIKMKLIDTTVTITTRSFTNNSTELKVKGRNKFLMPDIDAALSVYNKIVERL